MCGANISTLRFAKLLQKRGHKVIFITTRFKGSKDISNFEGIKTYRFFSVVVPKTDGKFFVAFPTLKQIKNILIKENIDVVHIMTPVPSGNTTVEAARKLGLKVVAHSHTQPENIFLHYSRIFRNKLVYHLLYKHMIRIYNKADIIACPSVFAEKKLKEHNPYLNTFVLSNGVELNKYKKIKFDSLLKKYNLNPKNKKLLFIGRLYPEKNAEILLKAMHKILKNKKDVNLMIVGDGPLKTQLEKNAVDLGIEKNVHFLGKISEKDLIQAYNASDIFVLPSFAELEGMVVLEAMACGKPIIISDSEETAAKYLVEDNGFVFKTRDPEDLSKKINMLLRNDKLRKKMSKNSNKQSKKYDINLSVDKLEGIYQNLLKFKQKVQLPL